LIKHKKITGSPILVFKNLPVVKKGSGTKVKRKDFFTVMQAPKLDSNSRVVTTLASYMDNMQKVFTYISATPGLDNDINNFFNSRILGVIAYAGKDIFELDTNAMTIRAKNLGDEASIKSFLKKSLTDSLSKAIEGISDKYEDMALNSAMAKHRNSNLSKLERAGLVEAERTGTRKNTLAQIEKESAQLKAQIEGLVALLDSMTESEVKDFVNDLKNLVHGKPGSLFGIGEPVILLCLIK